MNEKFPSAVFGLVAMFCLPLVGGLVAQHSEPNYCEQPTKSKYRNSPQRESVATIRAEHDDEKANQKTEADPPFGKITDWLLVFITGLLALYTRRLYQATAGLFTETAALRKGADDQRSDMLRSIAATESFAKAADTQNAIIAAQTDIIKKQHAVSRLQFLTTHRPRLRIRHVAIVRPSDITGLQTLLFHDGGEIKA